MSRSTLTCPVCCRRIALCKCDLGSSLPAAGSESLKAAMGYARQSQYWRRRGRVELADACERVARHKLDDVIKEGSRNNQPVGAAAAPDEARVKQPDLEDRR